MSCFWDGIRSAMQADWCKENIGSSPSSLLLWFKCLHPTIPHLQNTVSWQGSKLSKKLLSELLAWVTGYKCSDTQHGHLTSTCDPFLVLLSFACTVNISHTYCGALIRYKSVGASRTLVFHSNAGHFKYIRTDNIGKDS